MRFVWDRDKAAANLRKHGVDFHEAATAFGDPLSITIPDPQHSIGEERWLLVGQSVAGRLVVVAHTERGDEIRIINARPATRRAFGKVRTSLSSIPTSLRSSRTLKR
ncbi:MAG: BrnT family toxin [Chloroflexi bacterium]|nr:MAG: BrnT family toxin [Chloroflexota bacterium]